MSQHRHHHHHDRPFSLRAPGWGPSRLREMTRLRNIRWHHDLPDRLTPEPKAHFWSGEDADNQGGDRPCVLCHQPHREGTLLCPRCLGLVRRSMLKVEG